MAGIGHLAEAEIDPIREEDGQQADPIAARCTGPQIAEGFREAKPMINLEQNVGDADGSHVAVELEHERIGAVRHGFLKPVEMEGAVLKSPAEKKVSNLRTLRLTSLVRKLQRWQASEPSAFTISRR